eukprot:120523_1
MLTVLFTTLFSINSAYQYFGTGSITDPPLSFDEAKAYCVSIGTTIATIVSNSDRALAIAQIAGRAAPYIGLEDPTQTDKAFFFKYPSELDDICPIINSGACVPFWVRGQPIGCARDGGFTCTSFYPEARAGNGGINNDRNCDVARPFLCNSEATDPNGICENEDWGCNEINVVQPTFCHQDHTDVCICDKDEQGTTWCLDIENQQGDTSCDGYSYQCTSDADCVAQGHGYDYCMSGCCDGKFCLKKCPSTNVAQRRRMGDENEPAPGTLCNSFIGGDHCPQEVGNAAVSPFDLVNDNNGNVMDHGFFEDPVVMRLLFGAFLVFIFINNIFICYWCVCR